MNFPFQGLIYYKNGFFTPSLKLLFIYSFTLLLLLLLMQRNIYFSQLLKVKAPLDFLLKDQSFYLQNAREMRRALALVKCWSEVQTRRGVQSGANTGAITVVG